MLCASTLSSPRGPVWRAAIRSTKPSVIVIQPPPIDIVPAVGVASGYQLVPEPSLRIEYGPSIPCNGIPMPEWSTAPYIGRLAARLAGIACCGI
jgi:hypothetical protein